MPTEDAGAVGNEYPRAQVTRLEQHTRPDGSDATLSLLLEHKDGTTSQVEVEMAVTDYAWGSQWQADVRYAGQPPSHPETALVQLRVKTTYGKVRRTRRKDTVEITLRCADGRQRTQVKKTRLRLAQSRRQLSADEFRQRFTQFAAGGPFDARSGNGSLLEEPLAVSTLLVGQWWEWDVVHYMMSDEERFGGGLLVKILLFLFFKVFLRGVFLVARIKKRWLRGGETTNAL